MITITLPKFPLLAFDAIVGASSSTFKDKFDEIIFCNVLIFAKLLLYHQSGVKQLLNIITLSSKLAKKIASDLSFQFEI